MKKIAVLLASLAFIIYTAGCTSSDSKDDNPDQQAIADDISGADNGAPAADQSADASAAADNGAASNDQQGFLDEQLPDDAMNSQQTADNGAQATTGDQAAAPAPQTPPADAAAPAPQTPPADVAAGNPPPDNSAANLDQQSSASPDQASAAPSEPVPDLNSPTPPSSEPMAPTAESTPSPSDVAAAAPVSQAPAPTASLKKVEEHPIQRAGMLLNSVYIARQGDSYKSIAKMIYGDEGKQKELKKANPSIKKARPGDKIYYNSPVRSTDDSKVLTYYEDNGMVPEIYVAKDGDDLKKVSKDLLGYKNAWKEIWVTNAALESKDKLPAGTELRYWKAAPALPPQGAPQAMGEVAHNNPPPPAEMPPPAMNNPPPPQPQMNAAPPPPQMPPPQAQMNPPQPPPGAPPQMPPPDANNPAMNANPPPPPDLPPPPPAEAVNPPPPPAPPVAKKTIKPEGAPAEGMDQDLMMSLAGAGIVAAGLAALVIVRKRRQQKEMSSAFNDTQVGT
jgi:hypothetical protein